MNPMKLALVALPTGFLFGLGLVVSGLTDPMRVLGFLDVAGNWDPTLLFVMAGAVLVHGVFYRVIKRRQSPLLAGSEFSIPTRRDIDAKLIGGAVLFGMGWGLSGYCPGPAVVSLPSGSTGVLVFAAGMIGGIYLAAALQRAPKSRDLATSEIVAPPAATPASDSHRLSPASADG